MMIDNNTNRADLEIAILSEDGLYAEFDEQKLLNGGYTTEELRTKVIGWIEAGKEFA